MKPGTQVADRVEHIDVSGLDRRTLEALCLELRALAKRYGVEVAELRVVGSIEEGTSAGESA